MEKLKNAKSIQAFLAAANCGSATRAAKFLHTTQSSVSYHIKKLEDELGVPLFDRTPTGLVLTDHGALLASYAERGLALIQSGLEKVGHVAGSVRVALLPMLASRWLSPRLGDFWENHPDLKISVQTHNNTYARHEHPERFADLGIQWGRGDWNGFATTRLWPEEMVVVCSPRYLNTHPIDAPFDLSHCTLLHVDNEDMWVEWCGNNGLALSESQPQMMLEDRHFQLSSTINGLGVSLFAKWLITNELREGVLVDVFDRDFDTAFAYHLIVPKDLPPSKSSQVFRDWLLKQCTENAPIFDKGGSETIC